MIPVICTTVLSPRSVGSLILDVDFWLKSLYTDAPFTWTRHDPLLQDGWSFTIVHAPPQLSCVVPIANISSMHLFEKGEFDLGQYLSKTIAVLCVGHGATGNPR